MIWLLTLPTHIYNKEKTSTDTLQTVKNLVCLNSVGTAVISNKLMTNGKIIVFSKDQKSKERLDNLINSSNDLVSEEPRRNNPIILLKGVPKEIDRSQIPTVIRNHNKDIDNAYDSEDSITRCCSQSGGIPDNSSRSSKHIQYRK